MYSPIFRALTRYISVGSLALLACITGASADGSKSLQVSGAWLRATPPGSTVAAGYFTLHNAGQRDLKIVGVETKLAKSAEIHQSFTRNGNEEMRPVEGGLAVKAGQSARLAPGGYHVMLMGLDHPLVAGGTGTVTLVLDDGTRLEVTAPIRSEAPPGGSTP